jgi:hypothetical protein
MDAQTTVEAALTETLYRHIYFGHQVYKELAVVQDLIDPANQKALDFVQSWMLTLELGEIYRKSVVQNNLIDLHYLITSYMPTPELNTVTGEVLSA